MNLLELARLAFENLNRRKGRVVLTAIGVVIGTAAVVVLVSLGLGLQRSATESLYGIADLARIDVSPGGGGFFMGGGGGVMIAAGGGGGGGGGGDNPEFVPITRQSVDDFLAIPGVETVILREYGQVEAYFSIGRMQNWASLVGVDTDDLSQLGVTAQEGDLMLARGTAIVGYAVPQGFFDPSLRPGQAPPPPPNLMAAPLKLTVTRYTEDGPVTRQYQLRVAGVLEETQGESDWSVYIRLDDLNTINEWGRGSRIDRRQEGYQGAIVRAADPRDAMDIADSINAMGYTAFAQQEIVESVNGFFLILQVVFGGVGAIALLVAAIGIANTMTMAILERTREIGLMKAVGATNRDVLALFLAEAAGIGLVGGTGGVLVGWGLGQLINVLAAGFLASQMQSGGFGGPTLAAETPVGLVIFALLFSMLVGILSGLVPALRAANLTPAIALKYE